MNLQEIREQRCRVFPFGISKHFKRYSNPAEQLGRSLLTKMARKGGPGRLQVLKELMGPN